MSSSDVVVPVPDDGLGNTCYVVDLGDDRGLVVDPPRDLRQVNLAARRRGLRIAFAAETHLHADFLSGALQLASTELAQILASASGGRLFPHARLEDGTEVDLGGLTLRALTTPGHTDEHLSFLLLDGSSQIGVFTGGSLLVGSAARTDLVDPIRTEELARAQYRSLQRIIQLPDEVEVWPTHGAGSFCSAPAGERRTSTIAAEKATNPLLAASDEDTFVARLLDSLGSYPPYFRRLAEENRRGPEVLERAPTLAGLEAPTVQTLQARGAEIIDVRPIAEFALAHPAGALSIPLRPVFASWLGWLAPYDRTLVVVRNADQDPAEIAWQAAKIGYDNIVGELAGGIEAWQLANAPTHSITLTTGGDTGVAFLDIRQRAEYETGHVPGARHIELGDVAGSAAELADEPRVVMCGHGERAMGAASLLARAGHSQVRVLVGGPQDLVERTGQELERSP